MELQNIIENEMKPDHPLLSGFQSTLKSYLQELLEETKLDLIEKKTLLKEKIKDREDLGSKLYDEQEQLASIQENLQLNNDKYYNVFCQYQDDEKLSKTAKENYEKLKKKLQEERKTEMNCCNQLEKLNQQFLYIMKFSKNLSSHVSIIKTVNKKAEKEKNKVVFEQLKQDLLIYQHLNTLNQLREDIELYKKSISIQKEEAKEMKQEITEADVEIKVVNLEFKQLLSQQKAWLFTLTKKNELLSSVKTMISENQARIQVLKGEIKIYNMDIRKELEKNEQQSLLISQKKSEIRHLSNLNEKFQKDIQLIYNTYILLKSSINELENDYHKIKQKIKSQEIIYYKIVHEIQKRKSEIDTKEKEKMNLMFKLKCNKNCYHAYQNLEKLQEKIKKLELNSTKTENALIKKTLKLNDTKHNSEILRQQLQDLEKNIKEYNEELAVYWRKQLDLENFIKIKRRYLEKLNSKSTLSNKISEGDEIYQLKNEVDDIMSKIETTENDYSESEKIWFSLQCELINLNHQYDTVRKETNNLINRTELYKRKKLQIEDELDCQKKENTTIEHIIQNSQNDIVRLNMNLHNKKNIQGKLQQEFSLTEQTFMEKLKETELEFVQLENKLNDIKYKNACFYNEIIKKEKESLVWEKKILQANETKKSLHKHLYSELKCLKSEIHQKLLDRNNLKREQEFLQKDLEKSIQHYAVLYSKIENQNKLNKMKKKINNLSQREDYIQRKIYQIKEKISACDKEFYEIEDEKLKIKVKAEEYKIYLSRLELEINNKITEIEVNNQEKYKNLKKLALQQQKTKYYENIKKGKYLVLIHSNEIYKTELFKLQQQLMDLKAISEKINEEYPQITLINNKIQSNIELMDDFQ